MFTTDYQHILQEIRSIEPQIYANTRNFLDGAVTRLSPYITRGFVTLPEVRDIILERHTKQDAYKFIQELAWREYFQKTWISRGDDIFQNIRFEQVGAINRGVPDAVLSAETRINILDDGIKELYETGYTHNHMRMTLASLICNLARYRWLEPSRWLYYHLLDGDPASNTLSWQWVAGTSVSKQYTTSQSLINYWSKSNQSNTFLDFSREEFFLQPVPEHLIPATHLDLETKLPDSDIIDFAAHTDVFIYHPWHISPRWKKNEEGLRILLLQPSVFEKFPVSSKVLDFIIKLARNNIPDVRLLVAEESYILDQATHARIITVAHPTIVTIPSEERDWLFPEVGGYYKSFFAFWKECQKYF